MLSSALLTLLVATPPLVASVEVDAPEPARYTPYLGFSPGEPLEPERLREAVLRLFATGDFEDVVVEASPSEAGPRLVFRTRPAPKLRRVTVRGAVEGGAERLRRLARLRYGDALWPKRVVLAASEVAGALRADGWLDAQVHADRRPRPDGVDLVFDVQAGPRVFTRFAQVEGAPPEVTLGDLVRPRHDEPYRRAEAEAAAERMRERLAAAGYWRAVVELEEARVPGSKRLDLSFRVRPGPLMDLEVRGLDLPRGRRSEVKDLLRDGAARPDALEGGAERIETYLRRQGHRDALVRYASESDGAREKLVYQVTPGPVATVLSVEVPAAPELRELVDLTAGQPLLDEAVEEGARRLRAALSARGHASPRVEVVLREGGGSLPVLYRVEAGPATVVGPVTVAAPAGPDTAVQTELRLRSGEPYDPRLLAADRNRILTAYRNAGHLEATVEPELSWNEDRTVVDVTFRVAPGARAQVGQVVVSGLERTREKVVRRELTLEPAGPLSLERLLESQKRLAALGLFERVTVVPREDTAAEGARDVLVSLSEAPVTTIAYGLGYSERDLFRGSLEITRRNLFGLDRTLTAFGRVAFRGQRFVLSYREPFFLGRRRDLFTTAFYDDDDRTSFDFTRLGGIVQTTRRLRDDLAVILRLTYQATDVFNVEVPLQEIDRQFRTYTLAGPSASLVKDSRDNPLDARSGHFLSADMLFSLRTLGGAQFAKAFLQASRYARLRRELSVAFSARLGLAATFGSSVPDELPLPERFFAGGDYTLRGFAVDTVGPQEVGADGELYPTGGNGLLLGNAELRRDLGRAITLAVFFDLGNVYPLVGDMGLDDLRYSAGLGLRYRTPLGPIRLDWGVKLNPRPGESGYRVHLTVGNAY